MPILPMQWCTWKKNTYANKDTEAVVKQTYRIISKGKCTGLGVCLKQFSEFFVKTLGTTF